jgi:DNA-binding transcriptional MerR regulator
MKKNTNNANAPAGTDWIDGQQVIQLLNISKDALKDWRRRGIISYSRFTPGGKLYYDKNEIMRLLEDNRKRKKKD